MFSVMTGMFQVTAIGPMIKAITEAKIGGKLAYDVIDHVPSVNPEVKGAKKVDHTKAIGEIEFRNVEFTYPTR